MASYTGIRIALFEMVHLTKSLGLRLAGPHSDEVAVLVSSAGSIRLRKSLVTSNTLLDRFQELQKFLPRPLQPLLCGCIHNMIRQSPFALLEFCDLLLESIGSQDAVYEHRLTLANAMYTICGLILDCRIPPTVHAYYVISCS